MKRWMQNALLILLAAALVIGCSPSLPETPERETDLIVVGFSQVGSESSWRIANTESMKAALSEENGFELIFENAKQKQENQIKAVRTFIQQEVDYIVIAPIAETGWESVLEEARAEGIPVVIVDRQVDVQDESLYAARVGSDFRREAQMATEWLERELTQQGRKSDHINILHVQGTEGATAQIGRSAGLEEATAAHANWFIAAQLKGEYTKAKAYEVILEYLRTNRNIDVLYCENDDMAFGAMEAMDKLNIP
ncbi:MAG: substrate-binding domain-containing protein, partial [Eubacteriales bacterium]|nr:substrate-binding domain-containing protein [Eubacteriales bacterium]